MFAYIKGTLENKCKDHIVIESGGIGYKVFTSLISMEAIGQLGDNIKAYTTLYVREDIMNLYGFATLEELSMFELLISVSGIGPKAAISLLSTLTPARFGFAVITDDANILAQAQGIGKKTAQRIILELKDKIKKQNIDNSEISKDKRSSLECESNNVSESINALMILGYNKTEATKAITKINYEDLSIEEIIKEALCVLSKDRI